MPTMWQPIELRKRLPRIAKLDASPPSPHPLPLSGERGLFLKRYLYFHFHKAGFDITASRGGSGWGEGE